MAAHRLGRGAPHLGVALDETCRPGLLEQRGEPVAHFRPSRLRQRGDRVETRFRSLPSSAASARPVSISALTPGSVSTPIRSRSSARLASSSDRSISVTASSRTDAPGLDRAKRATAVLSTRRRPLFVPILVSSSRAAAPASCRESGSISSKAAPAPSSAGLDDEDLLIRAAEVQTIFEKRGRAPDERRMGWSGSGARRWPLPCRGSWPRAARRARREMPRPEHWADAGTCGEQQARQPPRRRARPAAASTEERLPAHPIEMRNRRHL